MRSRVLSAGGLLAVLILAPPAYAVPELGQVWLGVRAASSQNAKRYAATSVSESVDSEAAAQFLFPSDVRVSDMRVVCEGAPGNGKTFRFTSRPGGTAGNLTCDITGATEKACSATQVHLGQYDDIDGGTPFTVEVETRDGNATGRDCSIALRLTAKGDNDTPASPLIVFGDATAASPASNRYGAPSVTTATQRLNQTDEAVAGFIVPFGEIELTKFCVHLSSGVGTSRSETFKIKNATAVSDSLTIGAGDDSDCKPLSMTATAGHLLTVQFTRDGTAQSKARIVSIEYTGAGGWIGSSAPWRTATRYYTMQEGENTAASTLPQRVSQAGIIRNLYATTNGSYPNTAQVITLMKGTSAAAMTPQALSVTIPTTPTPGPLLQSDTTTQVVVAAGDYVNTEIKTAGGTGHTTMWAYEFVPHGDRYAVGIGDGTNDWAAAGRWAFASGGAGTAPRPTSLDHCVIDADSVDEEASGPVTLTVGASATCGTLDTTDYPGTLALGSSTLTVPGGLTTGAGTLQLGAGTLSVGNHLTTDGGTIHLGTGSLLLNGNLTSQNGTTWASDGSPLTITGSDLTITTNGATIPDLLSDASVTLQDAVTTLGERSWGLDITGTSSKVVNTNGRDVFTPNVRVTGWGKLTLGTSTIHLTGTGTVFDGTETALTNGNYFSGGSGTLSVEGNGGGTPAPIALLFRTFGGEVLGKLAINTTETVTLTPTSGSQYAFTLGELAIMPGATVRQTHFKETEFAASSPQITGGGSSPSNRATLGSTHATFLTTFRLSANTTISYFHLERINVTGGYTLTCVCCEGEGNSASVVFQDCATPTHTFTPPYTFTPTPTDTPIPTDTPAPTWTHTASPTFTPTPPDTATPTDTATPADTPTLNDTPTPTDTPTHAPTPSPTLTCWPTLGVFTPQPTATPHACVTPSVPDPVTAHFFLDPANPLNPFPSDRLRDPETGTVTLPPAYLDSLLPSGLIPLDTAALAAQFAYLDGFGTFSPIRIRFSRSMAGFHDTGGGIRLFTYDDLVANGASATPVRVTVSSYEPDRSLEIQPVLPLEPKTRYVLVLTPALTDGACQPVAAAAEFTAFLAAEEGLDCRQEVWQALLTEVVALFPTAVLVEGFTTQAVVDDLLTIQRRLSTEELTPGTPVFDGPPALEGGYHVYEGHFDAYDFRHDDGVGFDPERVSGAAAPRITPLAFAVAVPATPVPTPSPGYPVVVIGGAGAVQEHATATGLPLSWGGVDVTDVGDFFGLFAAVQITPAPVGERGTCRGSTQPCTGGDPHGLCANVGVCANDAARVCADDPDCEGSAECRHECIHITFAPQVLRDNLRQAVADLLQFTRMVQAAASAPEPVAPFDQLDTTRMLYRGGSYWGILGVVYLALQPEVAGGQLSVPGAGFGHALDSLLGLAGVQLVAAQYGLSAADPRLQEAVHGVRQLAQWALEAADPINYAPHLIVPEAQLCVVEEAQACRLPVARKRVLIVDGVPDNAIGLAMKDNLVLAMSLPDARATGGCVNTEVCGGCSGIWRYEMADYGYLEDGEGHAVDGVPYARTQVVRYLESVGTEILDGSPVRCCGEDEACYSCPNSVPEESPLTAFVCIDEACATVTPTLTPTPGPNDCCQGEATCGTPAFEAVCDYGVEAVYNAVCAESTCRLHTPTPTPGLGDCCDMTSDDEPPVPGCLAPVDGLGCPLGVPVYGVVCGPGGECVAPTATPTPGAQDCCDTGSAACDDPVVDEGCVEGVGVYNAECGGGGCATRTPAPTAGPLDCCEPVGAAVCDDPIAGCIAGSPVFGAVCTEFGCATPTPGPDDCCEGVVSEEWMCAAPPEDDLCEAHDPPLAPVYNAECSEGEVCVTRTPTATPTPTPLSCYPPTATPT